MCAIPLAEVKPNSAAGMSPGNWVPITIPTPKARKSEGEPIVRRRLALCEAPNCNQQLANQIERFLVASDAATPARDVRTGMRAEVPAGHHPPRDQDRYVMIEIALSTATQRRPFFATDR